MTKNTFLLFAAATTTLLTIGAGCSNNPPTSQTQPAQPVATQTSTAEVFVSGDWKTYQDKTYGYEFDYPQNWNLLEPATTDSNEYNVTIQNANQDTIQIVKPTYDGGSVNSRESYLKFLAQGGYDKVTIGGGYGYYSVTQTKGGPVLAIFLVGNKDILLMRYSVSDVTKTPLVEAEKFFKQIISSFTFNGTTASASGSSAGLTANFVIKELGIIITIPAQYKADWAYQIKSSADTGLMAMLFSKNVLEKDKNCGPGTLGTITKSKKLYDLYGASREPIAGTDFKLGDEYVTIYGPQALCTENKELQKTINDHVAALRRSGTTIEGGAEYQKNDLGNK